MNSSCNNDSNLSAKHLLKSTTRRDIQFRNFRRNMPWSTGFHIGVVTIKAIRLPNRPNRSLIGLRKKVYHKCHALFCVMHIAYLCDDLGLRRMLEVVIYRCGVCTVSPGLTPEQPLFPSQCRKRSQRCLCLLYCGYNRWLP